jgi:hypothetical protein
MAMAPSRMRFRLTPHKRPTSSNHWCSKVSLFVKRSGIGVFGVNQSVHVW